MKNITTILFLKILLLSTAFSQYTYLDTLGVKIIDNNVGRLYDYTIVYRNSKYVFDANGWFRTCFHDSTLHLFSYANYQGHGQKDAEFESRQFTLGRDSLLLTHRLIIKFPNSSMGSRKEIEVKDCRIIVRNIKWFTTFPVAPKLLYTERVQAIDYVKLSAILNNEPIYNKDNRIIKNTD